MIWKFTEPVDDFWLEEAGHWKVPAFQDSSQALFLLRVLHLQVWSLSEKFYLRGSLQSHPSKSLGQGKSTLLNLGLRHFVTVLRKLTNKKQATIKICV